MGSLASPQQIGRYAIHGKIASGGMASVHFGRLLGPVGFSRTVAIKRLHPHLAEDPEFVSTMIDEARLAARIHHPNVAPTLDVVSSFGELLVVMEYVRGESLARLARAVHNDGGRVALPIASAVAVGALHGLHAAHEARSDGGSPLGIVHRDVSPQNILVGVDGMTRIIDFGVAKAAGRIQTTRDGVVKGKMAYMAPEQLSAGAVSRTVDVYAMGVVLWELLAARRLFQADGDAQLVVQVLRGATEAPSRYTPDLPPELDALVMKALAHDPAERFESAEQMAEALQRVVVPAFATEVGRWVRDVAHEALERRASELAEIESALRAESIPPPAPHAPPRSTGSSARASAAEAARVDDGLTVATQPSSVSVETTRRAIPSRGAPRATRIVAWVGAVVLAAAVAGATAMARRSQPPGAVAAAALNAARSTIAPSSAPPAASVAPAPPSAAVSVATAAPTPPAPVRVPQAAPRARSLPKPVGSIRFAQPD
jgi:serine/threonine-protein kinase